jgi:hypothetical protein
MKKAWRSGCSISPQPPNTQMLDLMKMSLDAKDIVTMPMKGAEVIKLLNP